jgi:Mlc titration factor MtfA (ptsG expression regulator)
VISQWWHRLQRYLLQRRLRRTRIPFPLWHGVVGQIPLLQRLPVRDRCRLRQLAGLFLQRKAISGAGDTEPDERMRVTIAAQACLLILNLDLDYFEGWVEIILYPDAFRVNHEQVDSAGVVHRNARSLGGEAWGRGPVILSWADIDPRGRGASPGHNVVLHEFAHKLDMLNGPADGLPPLHPEMPLGRWSEDFSRVYEKLQRQVASHHRTAIDPYAGTNPAEFFAVVTEVFFEQPALLHQHYPELYGELRAFYRQDPLHWQDTTVPA